MFDEYVEHAAFTSAGPTGASLQYEGFEPSPYEEEDAIAVQDGLPQGPTTDVAAAPIFALGEVQCPLNAPLVSLVVCSDMLAMGLASNTLILIELAHSTQVIRIPLPPKPQDFTLYKLFMDPSGKHIIITSTQGENWYLYRSWKKPRQLKSFKMVIESVAWNKAALLSTTRPTSTREILVGARNGDIYEAMLDAEEDFFRSQERYVQRLFTVPEKQPVTGLRYDFFQSSEGPKALVIASTPTRFYQFTGSPDRKSEEGRIFTNFFRNPQILELPGDLRHSDLEYYTPQADQAASLPKSLAWMTAAGIYHGSLNFEASDNFVDAADILPYPSEGHEFPLSIALTEFHYVLLYTNRITAVSTLNNEVAYEELLAGGLKPTEQIRGITSDPVRKTYWVYTDQSIFELLVDNEDRDVWKLYLQRQEFEVALRYSKTAGQRNHILSLQADSLFQEGKYYQAAQCYARCSTPFEEVALKFVDVGERDALRSYLISRLEDTPKTNITQRMMLATWLVEIYLSKCNELDDAVASEAISHDVDNLRTERSILEEDLRQFFVTYKTNLDRRTTYELIQGHGRTDMYLHYATVIGDFERVVEHWIMEEEWSKAIDVVNRQTDLELYYRFGPVLMRNAPQETVDSWIKQAALDPLRLIPSLLQSQHITRDVLSPNHAIRYLNHVVFELQSTSSTVHNLLITLYISPSSSSNAPDDGPLLRFLSTAPQDAMTDKPYYDLDYALRLCKQAGRTQPCVHIYSKMGLYENSVDLALEKGDLELAKLNADKPEDDVQLRKKLWLKIARYVVQDKKDIKTAMQFLESTDLLKIEDILPFFPDFVVIDDFKEEIAHALEGYSSHIDTLKNEMNEATQTAESIKQDITALKNRFITIDAHEGCSVCSQLLLARQFYVFPCRHSFHADCLIGLAREYLPAHALRRIVALQNELVKNAPVSLAISNPSVAAATVPAAARNPQTQRTLLSSNFIPNPIQTIQTSTRAAGALGRNLLSAGDKLRDLIVPDALAAVVSAPVAWIPGVGGRKGSMEVDGGKKAEKLRAELDDLLASSCPLCESVVVGLDKPFVLEGEVDTTWAL